MVPLKYREDFVYDNTNRMSFVYIGVITFSYVFTTFRVIDNFSINDNIIVTFEMRG